MSDKKLYQQKMKAQLDEWSAEIDKLEAQASGVSADIQLKLNKQVKALKDKVSENRKKLDKIDEAGEDAWNSIKQGIENAWDAMGQAISDLVAKIRK